MYLTNLISLKPSHIPFLAAKEPDEIAFEALDNWKDYDFSQITNWITTHGINLSDGDIISFAPPDRIYRNGSKCVWYGGAAHGLAHNIDEYGALPHAQEIEIGPGKKFTPRSWSHTIDHNGIYWVCEEYRLQCVENIQLRIVNNEKLFLTWFEHNETKEFVVYNTDYVNINHVNLNHSSEEPENTDDDVIEKFKSILLNPLRPFEWNYLAYADVYVREYGMDETNTSIIHGLDDEVDS